MFGSIGGPELILIFLVALLIFGPRKLPELGRMLGKGLGEFRRAANDLRVSLETEVARETPARDAEGGATGTAPTLAAAPGATPRQGSAPLDDASTAPAVTAAPAPAVAPDARDADRAH
jgi:sec-independent protein translocase protein TatA